jgi:serine/threonine-protein kinase
MVRQVGHEGDTLTLDGAVVGTPAYMSPEQANGEATLDGRSDIYSVGAVGYFLLTGVPPFERDSAVKVLVAHVSEAPDAVRLRRADAPADLDAVLMRCLAKSPADRFPDVQRLDEALARCGDAARWTPSAAGAWWARHTDQIEIAGVGDAG